MLNKRLVILLVIITGLAACAAPKRPGVPTPTLPAGPSVADAEELAGEGKFPEAALIYQRLASRPGPEQRRYQLRAADMLLKAGQATQAKLTLREVDMTGASEAERIAYHLAQARVALAERNSDGALQWLSQVPRQEGDKPAQALLLELRASAYELTNNPLAAVELRVAREAYLETSAEIETNQRRILDMLQALSDKQLTAALKKFRDDTLRGWVELAIVVHQTRDPMRLSGLIQHWRKQFPTHPIQEAVISALTPQAKDLPPDIRNIALLLPFEGPYSKVAEAVRDGFLTAYYSQSGEKRATVRFYNTGSSGQNVVALYEQAVAEGADVVVGPLNKQLVEALARHGQLSVPTIALNQLSDPTLFNENLFQFGLSPEAEAQQLAVRAWADGHHQAAALYPQGEWGERVFNAFREQWESLGGMIVSAHDYNAKQNDFSPSIVQLLNIRDSHRRHRALSGILRQRVQFEPRRREDIDYVFMAAFPRQARLIPPQLKFYRAGDLPVYATSHAFTGKQDRNADRDMNGVIIGDMPWTLERKNGHPLRSQVYNTWPDSAEKLSRLYALGVDAYNVLYYLNWLRANPAARLPGATGQLRIGSNNRLMRQLSWARFRGGRPRLLPSSALLSTQ